MVIYGNVDAALHVMRMADVIRRLRDELFVMNGKLAAWQGVHGGGMQWMSLEEGEDLNNKIKADWDAETERLIAEAVP